MLQGQPRPPAPSFPPNTSKLPGRLSPPAPDSESPMTVTTHHYCSPACALPTPRPAPGLPLSLLLQLFSPLSASPPCPTPHLPILKAGWGCSSQELSCRDTQALRPWGATGLGLGPLELAKKGHQGLGASPSFYFWGSAPSPGMHSSVINVTPWRRHSKDGGLPTHSRSSPSPGTLSSRIGTFPPQRRLGMGTLPDPPARGGLPCRPQPPSLCLSSPPAHTYPRPPLDWDKRFFLRVWLAGHRKKCPVTPWGGSGAGQPAPPR